MTNAERETMSKMERDIKAAVEAFCLEQDIGTFDVETHKGLVKAFEIGCRIEGDRVLVTCFTGWGTKFLAQIKSIAVGFVRASFGVDVREMYHQKRGERRTWCTYFSNGNHDGYATGFKFPMSVVEAAS